MNRLSGRTLFLLLIPILLGAPLLAATAYAEDITYNPEEPVPYTPEEFPQWSRDVRRGEIIAIGAFPVAMIISGISYELGRFGYHSIKNGAPDAQYAPWFFSTNPEGPFTNQERIGLVLSSAVLSVGVALVDFILGKRAERNK